MLRIANRSPGKSTENATPPPLPGSQRCHFLILFAVSLLSGTLRSETVSLGTEITPMPSKKAETNAEFGTAVSTLPIGTDGNIGTPIPPQTGSGEYEGASEHLLASADRIFESGSAIEAWEQVARTGCTSDLRFVSRILRFGLSAGKFDETLVILAEAKSVHSWTEPEWRMIAEIYEKSGQIVRAIETISRKVNDHIEYLRLQARQEMIKENIPEAIFYQEQYIAQLDPPLAKAWSDLATLYLSQNRADDASRAFQRAREIQEESAPSTPEVPQPEPATSHALP
jgi:tetratricopeptide (TPR) repeat protein